MPYHAHRRRPVASTCELDVCRFCGRPGRRPAPSVHRALRVSWCKRRANLSLSTGKVGVSRRKRLANMGNTGPGKAVSILQAGHEVSAFHQCNAPAGNPPRRDALDHWSQGTYRWWCVWEALFTQNNMPRERLPRLPGVPQSRARTPASGLPRRLRAYPMTVSASAAARAINAASPPVGAVREPPLQGTDRPDRAPTAQRPRAHFCLARSGPP